MAKLVKGNRIQSQPRGLSSRRGYSTQIQTSAPIEAEDIEPVEAAPVEEFTSISPETVILNTGEYVLKSEFDKLTPAQQSQLKTQGIALFNLSQDRALAASVVQLNTGEYVSKTDYDALNPADQLTLMVGGIAHFGDIKRSQQFQEIETKYVQLQTGEYLDRVEFEKLSPYDQSLLKAMGVTGFNSYKQGEYAKDNIEVRPGEFINRGFFESLPPTEQRFIRTQGVEAYNAGKQAEYAENQALFNRAIQWMSVDSNGNRIIDVVSALSHGFTTPELNKLGITDEQIRQAYNAEPGFNTIVIPPEQQFAEMQSKEGSTIPPTAVFQKLEDGVFYYTMPEAITIATGQSQLEPYAISTGGYDIESYIGDKGVSAETIGTLQNAGYSAPVINAVITLAPYGGDIGTYIKEQGVSYQTISVMKEAGYSAPVINAIISLAPYNNDVIQFARENPQAATILTAAGYKPEDVAKAVETAKLAPYYNDFLATYLAQKGITQEEIDMAEASQFRNLGGIAGTISYDYRFPEESQAQYEARAKVEQAKLEAYSEYIEEYGGKSFAQSVAAMYIAPVFPVGRAIRPDVLVGEITAGEWAQTAGMALALAAIPLSGGAAGILVNTSAAGAFAAHTALEWGRMTPQQRAVSVAADIAFGIAVGGSAFASWLKTANLGADGLTASTRIKAFLKELATSERGAVGYTTQKAVDATTGRIIEVKVAQRGFQPGLSGSKVMTVERTAVEASAWKPVSKAQSDEAMRMLTETLARNAKPSVKDIETLANRIGEKVSNVPRGKLISWIDDNIKVATETVRPAPSQAGQAQYQAWLEKIRAIPEWKPAPKPQSDIAILAKELQTTGQVTLQTPVISTAGVNPELVTVIWGMARSAPMLTPDVTANLYRQYGITPENVNGNQVLTQSQLVDIAQSVGVPETMITEAIDANVLAQVVIRAIAKAEVTPETSALASAVAKVATETELQPMVSVLPSTTTITGTDIFTAPAVETSTATETATETQTITDVSVYNPPITDYPPPMVTEPAPGRPLVERIIRPRKTTKKRSEKEEEERAKFNGAFAFKHGFGWVALKKPYYREEDVKFFRIPPPGIIDVSGGKGAAYRSIQQYLEDNDLPDIHIKRGIMKITITKARTKEPGAVGAIKFETTQRGRVKQDELDLDEWLEKSETVSPPDVSAPYQQERKSDNTAPGFRVKIDDKMAW